MTLANMVYYDNQLTDDTSVCFGGGGDGIVTLGVGDSINCGGLLVEGFDGANFLFTLSAQSGDDTVFAESYDDDLAVCGGSGEDLIQAGGTGAYVSGGSDGDYILGGVGSDTLRGGSGSGSDLITHLDSVNADWLRGEDGPDCLEVFGPAMTNHTNSCGSGSDYYDNGGSRPDSCETATTSCCSKIACPW